MRLPTYKGNLLTMTGILGVPVNNNTGDNMSGNVSINDTYIKKDVGGPQNTQYHYDGVENPIALMQTTNNKGCWIFTSSFDNISKASGHIIYGSTVEEMVRSLELFLELPERAADIKFMDISIGPIGPCNVQILNWPKVEIILVEDIVRHLHYVDKHKRIMFTLPEDSEHYIQEDDIQNQIQELIGPKGYVIDGSYVKKNKKLATQRRKSKALSKQTFNVWDLEECFWSLNKEVFLGHDISVASERVTGLNYMKRIINLLALIERAHGKNSRRRVVAYQKMLKRWKTTKARTAPFKTENFKPYVDWLDKESSKRKSSGTLITHTNIIRSMLEIKEEED